MIGYRNRPPVRLSADYLTAASTKTRMYEVCIIYCVRWRVMAALGQIPNRAFSTLLSGVEGTPEGGRATATFSLGP